MKYIFFTLLISMSMGIIVQAGYDTLPSLDKDCHYLSLAEIEEEETWNNLCRQQAEVVVSENEHTPYKATLVRWSVIGHYYGGKAIMMEVKPHDNQEVTYQVLASQVYICIAASEQEPQLKESDSFGVFPHGTEVI